MKRENVNFFVFIVLTLFVLSIAFFCLSIVMDVIKGKTQATGIFSDISNNTNYMINQLGFSEDFSTYFLQFLQKEEKLAALVITKDSNTVFAYPISSPMIFIDDFGEPVLKGNSPFVKVFSNNLETCYENNITVIAAIYLTTPAAIFKFARITFFIILLSTVFVFCILMYYYKKYNSKKAYSLESSQNVEKINEMENLFDKQKDTQIENKDDIFKEKYEHKAFDSSLSLEKQQIQSEVLNNTNYVKNFSDPQGLFSNRTGLGWESYFETRLDSEIARSASAQQDLCLFIIKIADMPLGSKCSNQITDLLLSYFKFRDLIFEYENDGYTAIVQDMDLDSAMSLSQEFYTDLSAILINNDIPNKIAIGISTRSLRLLTGERLIDEAKQAVKKAFEEEGLPIVAFKVDLKKYHETL
ncbi:MAG: hypothetical protein ACTTHG_01490 [Treponemataceae bacterium]